MIDYDELCALYTDGAPAQARLETWLKAHARDGLELLVDANDDRAGDKTDPLDGFLFYDHIIEVYFAPGAPLSERVATVAAILDDLRGRGLKVVPACDYEDALPR